MTGVTPRVDRARDLWTMALIFTVWAWIIVPKTVQSVLSPKYRNSVGVPQAPYSRLAALADYGLYLGVIVVCLAIIVVHLNKIDWYGFGLLLCLLAPWAYMVVRNTYAAAPLLEEGVCYPLIVIALWMLKPDFRRLEVLGYLIGLTSVVSVLLALALPTHAIFRTAGGAVIVTDKQIIPGGILVGVFTQGNNLGQFVALGLPAVLLIQKKAHRLPLVGISLLTVVWSASRGSMLALVIGGIAYAVVRLSRPAMRKVVAPLLVLVPSAAVCVIPLVTVTETAFTNRGLIWLVSLKSWRADIWFGHGANWFDVVGNSSSRIAGSVFHGHNQFVQFMVTGGILFGLVVLPQIGAAIVRSTRTAMAGDLFGISWLAVLAGSCLLEKSFTYVDNANFLFPMVIPFAFLLLARSGGPAEPGAAPVGTRAHPARQPALRRAAELERRRSVPDRGARQRPMPRRSGDTGRAGS